MSTLTEADLAGQPVTPPPRARTRRGPSRAKLVNLTIQAAIVAILLGAWEWLSRSGRVDPLLAGRPSEIGPAIGNYVTSSEGLDSMGASALAVGISFVLGTTTGILAGLILGLSRRLDAVLGPFLTPLNSIPRIALAPLFIAWFGLTTTAKVVLAVSIVFFMLAENARSAVRSVDPETMRMGRVVGLGPIAQLWKVVIPSAVPTMFAGLRLAFIYSMLGVVASEMIAAPNGVGADIVRFSTSYEINSTFAVLAVLVTVSIVVNALLSIVERRLLRWQPRS